MRFDEPDVREAYRLGARDCFESVAASLGRRRAREIEAWLKELETWQEEDPPLAPAAPL
jgi:hypothetical protein